MSLGFNSKVQLGDGLYHVQTEDRGLIHPFIDTVVLSRGQVLHRRSSSYQELLDSGTVDQDALRARVEQQHRDVLDALRGGALQLEKAAAPVPAATEAVAGVAGGVTGGVAGEVTGIEVKLCNAASWLVAGEASLEILVYARGQGSPLDGADVEVLIEGAAEGSGTFWARTDAGGRALVSFALPQLTSPENAALVIRARVGEMREQLRYRLKPSRRDSAPISQ